MSDKSFRKILNLLQVITIVLPTLDADWSESPANERSRIIEDVTALVAEVPSDGHLATSFIRAGPLHAPHIIIQS